jgi:hypothetical protein
MTKFPYKQLIWPFHLPWDSISYILIKTRCILYLCYNNKLHLNRFLKSSIKSVPQILMINKKRKKEKKTWWNQTNLRTVRWSTNWLRKDEDGIPICSRRWPHYKIWLVSFLTLVGPAGPHRRHSKTKHNPIHYHIRAYNWPNRHTCIGYYTDLQTIKHRAPIFCDWWWKKKVRNKFSCQRD